LFEDNAEKLQSTTDLMGIDPRSIKKLKDILSLPAEDRNDLYRILNKMLRKNQLEKQNSPFGSKPSSINSMPESVDF
jgi:hypothetical protein